MARALHRDNRNQEKSKQLQPKQNNVKGTKANGKKYECEIL